MSKSFLNCKDNIFDLAKFTYVQNKDGIVRLSTRGYQRKVLTLMQLPPICGNKTNIILKQPRQSGSTLEATLFIMHKLLFEPNCSIAIVSTKKEWANDLIAKLKLSLENLPKEWSKDGVFIKSTKHLIWNNGNNSAISAQTYGTITRQDAPMYKYLFLDNFAFAKDEYQEKMVNLIFPTILNRKDTKIIISSATNGTENEFYKLCVQAMGAKSPFLMVEIPWWDVYNFNVKEMKTRADQIGTRAWMREYGLFFDDYDD